MTVQFQGVDVDFLLAPMGREQITQNELSGRYRTIPDRFLEMPSDVVAIVAKRYDGRGSQGFQRMVERDYCDVLEAQRTYYATTLEQLREGRDRGHITAPEYKRAREVLRGVLGTAYLTDMRILCNLHALEWILTQRLATESQFEARVIALRMYDAARADDATSEIMAQMAIKNGWDEHLMEIRDLIRKDSRTET
jgi:thymidylate synthase ThyX